MATTVNLLGDNINKATPLWFTKTKNAVSMLADTGVIILLAAGIAKDNSLLILVLRVGISGLFNAAQAILGETNPVTPPAAETK